MISNKKLLLFTKTNMKTFLWTTLFWIIVAIAWLLCLWFGNLGTQVLDNEWIISFLPNNIKDKVWDSIVAFALEEIDRCAAAEAKDCYPEVEVDKIDTEDNTQVNEALENIITNQQIIYTYLQESFARTNQTISDMQINSLQEIEEPVIDEREQQRLQLQAQIEALQNEMASL